MQYAFSMTSRMVTIAVTCAVLLCGLLFLLGVEIGVRFVAPAWSGGDAAARSASPSPEPARLSSTFDEELEGLPTME